MVANENDLGALVVAFEEHVQEQIEALGQALDALVHRSRYVHQAEHDGLRRRFRVLAMQLVAQIVGVEEWHAADAPLELLYFDLEARYGGLVAGRFGLLELLLGSANRRRLEPVNAMRLALATRMERTTERLAGVPSVAKPARACLEARVALQVQLGHVRQSQIIEQEVEKLAFGNGEGKVVLSFALVGGLAVTAAATSGATARAGKTITSYEFLVAGVNDRLLTARAVGKVRLDRSSADMVTCSPRSISLMER